VPDTISFFPPRLRGNGQVVGTYPRGSFWFDRRQDDVVEAATKSVRQDSARLNLLDPHNFRMFSS
jgi:hypothetical protein